MTAAFRLDHVTKTYRKKVALYDVSLTGEAGQVIALLGENGAGKTTALKILLGLIKPDGGKAEVLGLDSRSNGQVIRQRVGYVAERPTLYEWMTVAEIGWFAAGFYSAGYVDNYRKLIKNFDLPEDRKIKALSKGMKAKVALSLAMAHEPPVLILDEPTSGLDPMVRRDFLESMVEVAGAGRTVLLSSHQIAEVERVADVVAILRNGKLAAIERLDDLKQNVRKVTLTLNNGLADMTGFPGRIITRTQAERQLRLLVRELDEAQLDSFRERRSIAHVEAHSASLEEIFLGYMRAEPQVDTEDEIPPRPKVVGGRG